MKIDSWVLEMLLLIFFILIYRESRIVLGKERANIFLWGSIFWTGVIENVGVMIGGYDYFGYANYYTFGSRIIDGYAGFMFWVLVVPLCICLGWFLLSLPAMVISIRTLGEKSNIWLKAGFAAFILVCFDMLLDPISVVNEWWRWTSPGYYLRGVTFSNYIGWFFLLFFFGAIYERTVIQLRGFRWLNKIERSIFKTDTADLSDMDYGRLARVFYFRLLAFYPIFFLCTMIVSTIVLLAFGNNFGPFDSVFPNDFLMSVVK